VLCRNVDHEPTDPHPSTRCATSEFDYYCIDIRNFIHLLLPLLTSHNTELLASESRPLENVVLARPVRSSRNGVMSALRSPFDSKSHVDTGLAPKPRHSAYNNDVELDIQVCVERSVVVDYMNDSEYTSSWGKPDEHS